MSKVASLVQILPFGRQKTKIKIYGKQNSVPQSRSAKVLAFVSTTQVSAVRAGNRTTSLETKKIWTGYALALGIVVLFAVHLVSVNYNVGTGYQISKVQNKLAALSEENKRLMLKSSETGSIASIQENFSAENYVPVTGVEYVFTSSSSPLGLK